MRHRHMELAVGAWSLAWALCGLSSSVGATEVASNAKFEARDIKKWKANGAQGLWIEVDRGRWLYATFQAPCTDLPSSVSARVRWSMSQDLQVGASVLTASGKACPVRRIDEVKAAGSTTPIGGDMEGVTVEGRAPIAPDEPKDVPQCGVRAIVWALTKPGSAWRLLTPVENTGPASACVAPASGYRWSTGTMP